MEPAMVSAQFDVMYQVKHHLSFEGLVVKTKENRSEIYVGINHIKRSNFAQPKVPKYQLK